MLTPAKGSRRSTRVGRYVRTGGGGGGRTLRGGSSDEAAPSWQASSSDREARKWIQVMRPPAPNARFFIPTWVPLDELTPEEKSKYVPATSSEETAVDDSGDTAMTASGDGKEVERKPPAEQSESVVESSTSAIGETESSDDVMISEDAKVQGANTVETKAAASTNEVTIASETKDAEVEPMDTQETKSIENPVDVVSANAQPTDVPVGMATDMIGVAREPSQRDEMAVNSSEARAPDSAKAIITKASSPLSPLAMTSRETSEGIPPSIVDSKALESIEPLEGKRPHDPVADKLEEPGAVPPSRPISEPAAILMEGPAAPLIGDSVVSPVPEKVAAPPTDSIVSAAPLAAASDSSDHPFVHKDSDTTPFHTFAETTAGEENVVHEAQLSTAETSDEHSEVMSERPDAKRPRTE